MPHGRPPCRSVHAVRAPKRSCTAALGHQGSLQCAEREREREKERERVRERGGWEGERFKCILKFKACLVGAYAVNFWVASNNFYP